MSRCLSVHLLRKCFLFCCCGLFMYDLANLASFFKVIVTCHMTRRTEGTKPNILHCIFCVLMLTKALHYSAKGNE